MAVLSTIAPGIIASEFILGFAPVPKENCAPSTLHKQTEPVRAPSSTRRHVLSCPSTNPVCPVVRNIAAALECLGSDIVLYAGMYLMNKDAMTGAVDTHKPIQIL